MKAFPHVLYTLAFWLAGAVVGGLADLALGNRGYFVAGLLSLAFGAFAAGGYVTREVGQLPGVAARWDLDAAKALPRSGSRLAQAFWPSLAPAVATLLLLLPGGSMPSGAWWAVAALYGLGMYGAGAVFARALTGLPGASRHWDWFDAFRLPWGASARLQGWLPGPAVLAAGLALYGALR